MEQVSSELGLESIEEPEAKSWIYRHKMLLIFSLAAVAVLGYAGVTGLSEPGYPLDDSWIHQTYARNLVETGRWQFGPGLVSNGSTSPLWTLILSAAYLLGLPHLLWSFFLGWLCLAWSAISAMDLWETLWPEYRSNTILVGLTLVFTWPFVWAAASGMETLLFTALVLQVLRTYVGLNNSSRLGSGALGLLCGLVIATRPDGLALVILVVFGMGLKIISRQLKLINFLIYIFFGFLTLVPYFAFNRTLSGEWWPNTLYAKQAEYAFLWDQPLIIRTSQLMLFSLGGADSGLRGISGAQLLLIPGLIAATISAIKKDITNRQLLQSIALIWAAGHVFIFAWRLPVIYQHGRYLWPVVPIWIIYGFAGWRQLLRMIEGNLLKDERVRTLVSFGAKVTFGIMLLIFYILGLQAYITDVAFVNGEMVDVAIWLRNETPENALIAAHDIGAIGYFSEKSLIDLAGLVSPEVIPLLDDEILVEEFVQESGADYLVTAPGWSYDGITKSGSAQLVYSTDFPWTRSQGFNNMAVYLLADK